MTLKRHIRHVDCEYCTAATTSGCIICGGNGYVELATWREDGEVTPEGQEHDRVGEDGTEGEEGPRSE